MDFAGDEYVAVTDTGQPYAAWRRPGYRHCAYGIFDRAGRLLCLTEYLVGAITATNELNRLAGAAAAREVPNPPAEPKTVIL